MIEQECMFINRICFSNRTIYLLTDAMKKDETLLRIKNARQRVRNEIEDLTERLRITQENIKRVRHRSIDSNPSSGIFHPSTHENIKREIVD